MRKAGGIVFIIAGVFGVLAKVLTLALGGVLAFQAPTQTVMSLAYHIHPIPILVTLVVYLMLVTIHIRPHAQGVVIIVPLGSGVEVSVQVWMQPLNGSVWIEDGRGSWRVVRLP